MDPAMINCDRGKSLMRADLILITEAHPTVKSYDVSQQGTTET